MKICVFTGTRAEYGIMEPLLRILQESKEFLLQVIASGTHLDSEFGSTIDSVRKGNYETLIEVPILVRTEGQIDVSATYAKAVSDLPQVLRNLKPDLALVVGDRYETLAFATCCLLNKVPLAHIHGGETSEGAVDESIRHAISKMSQFHFTSAEIHSKRLKQLGEDPKNIWTVGAPGLDSLSGLEFINREELFAGLGLSPSLPLIVATLHPETLGEIDIASGLKQVTDALVGLGETQVLWTKSNADEGGDLLNHLVEQHCATTSGRHILVSSLGAKKYFSAVKESCFVIGNSSSGLIEVPLLGKPTINIGDRQKGRLTGESVISTKWDTQEIRLAIDKAMDELWASQLTAVSPYGDGNSSQRIFKKLLSLPLPLKVQKPFFDI